MPKSPEIVVLSDDEFVLMLDIFDAMVLYISSIEDIVEDGLNSLCLVDKFDKNVVAWLCI